MKPLVARQTLQDRDPGRLAVEQLAGVPAGLSGVDHGENAVTVRPAHEPVGRLAVGRAEGTLAIDDCLTFRKLVHDFLPVRMTT